MAEVYRDSATVNQALREFIKLAAEKFARGEVATPAPGRPAKAKRGSDR